jgi:hypothetical protein
MQVNTCMSSGSQARDPAVQINEDKHLLASIDQLLSRLGLDYVDIFYHHRPDRLVTLRTSLVEICCPARCAHVICPRRRGDQSGGETLAGWHECPV